MLGERGGDNVFVFGRRQGAGAVNQLTVGFEEGKEGGDEKVLEMREGSDTVGGPDF